MGGIVFLLVSTKCSNFAAIFGTKLVNYGI